MLANNVCGKDPRNLRCQVWQGNTKANGKFFYQMWKKLGLLNVCGINPSV